MPIYEYECGECLKIHEVSQRITDESLKICPTCGGSLKKLISLSSFALKGSGFYTTDYKRPQKKPENKAPAACGAASGGCGKAECK